jgi:hypothetical protein
MLIKMPLELTELLTGKNPLIELQLIVLKIYK